MEGSVLCVVPAGWALVWSTDYEWACAPWRPKGYEGPWIAIPLLHYIACQVWVGEGEGEEAGASGAHQHPPGPTSAARPRDSTSNLASLPVSHHKTEVVSIAEPAGGRLGTLATTGLSVYVCVYVCVHVYVCLCPRVSVCGNEGI